MTTCSGTRSTYTSVPSAISVAGTSTIARHAVAMTRGPGVKPGAVC